MRKRGPKLPVFKEESGEVTVPLKLRFSKRDIRILEMLAAGGCYKEMQAELGIGKTRLARLIAVLRGRAGLSESKLGPASNLELVAWAVRKGVID